MVEDDDEFDGNPFRELDIDRKLIAEEFNIAYYFVVDRSGSMQH